MGVSTIFWIVLSRDLLGIAQYDSIFNIIALLFLFIVYIFAHMKYERFWRGIIILIAAMYPIYLVYYDSNQTIALFCFILCCITIHFMFSCQNINIFDFLYLIKLRRKQCIQDITDNMEQNAINPQRKLAQKYESDQINGHKHSSSLVYKEQFIHTAVNVTPHVDHKKLNEEHEEIEKELCETLLDHHPQIQIEIIKTLETLKKHPQIKHKLQIFVVGSYALRSKHYKFASDILDQPNSTYGKFSDIDVKFYTFGFSQKDWEIVADDLATLAEKIESMLPHFLSTANGGRIYRSYPRGKRHYVSTEYASTCSVKKYLNTKSQLLIYGSDNITFPYEGKVPAHHKAKQLIQTIFSLIRMKAVVQDSYSKEVYKVELLDISMPHPDSATFLQPLQLIDYINDKCITINGLHWMKFKEQIAENDRMMEHGRSEGRTLKCIKRHDVLIKIQKKYHSEIQQLETTYASNLHGAEYTHLIEMHNKYYRKSMLYNILLLLAEKFKQLLLREKFVGPAWHEHGEEEEEAQDYKINQQEKYILPNLVCMD